MVKGVTVIEARMDEGSGYCGSGGGIKSVSDGAKIANMVLTGAVLHTCIICFFHSLHIWRNKD